MDKPNQIQISVITVCYNNINTIEKCILSVAQQNFTSKEHIVIDGKSTDGTYKVLAKYSGYFSQLVHEKDKGIYHAMNKGLDLAKGNFVLFLNADDTLKDSQSLSYLYNLVGKNDAVLGSVGIFKKDKLFRFYNAMSFRPWMFIFGHQPPHPGFLAKRSLINQIGGFNESFKIAGDFDLMLRLFNLPGFTYVATKTIVNYMQHGGASSGSFSKKVLMNREIKIALKKNGAIAVAPFIWSKYLIKVLQLRL